jgi:hypothetical protein
MRNDDLMTEHICIASLLELDALVGTRLTGETPRTHWEDGHTHFVFSSVEEALEALRDPYYKNFMPADSNTTTVLTEIKEFRRYSSDLNAAWDVVETVGRTLDPLQVRREESGWVASFGPGPVAVARTAPMAICVAALLARGIEVEFTGDAGQVAVQKRA